MIRDTAFYHFLSDSIDKGGFSNDDVAAVMMPLLEEVSSFHTSGLVAPLHQVDSLLITNDKLDIDESRVLLPVNNLKAIEAIQPQTGNTFEITSVHQRTVEIGEYHKTEEKNLAIRYDKNQPLTAPVFLPDYKCYEMELGHHDAVSDIFVLGMIMASLSLHLDFTDISDLENFVRNRQSMVFLNQSVHPAIANIIAGMTEPDRRKRWKDLPEIIAYLKNYRDYNPEKEMDLAEVVAQQPRQNRQQLIQAKLRNRLFDTSRRNRLLYFKPNLKFVNLTVASVPNVLNYKNIDPETLFTWNSDVSPKIKAGKDISLSKYLRFEENGYLAPSLDRIRLEASRDINEYGFSQLRLAICFLHWYNMREQQTEKISSPLLLIPVSLVKKKGVKDQFILQVNDTEAEINPVLSNMLKELYNIRLPESISLNESGPEDIFNSLRQQIAQTRSGIVVEYVNKPRIRLIHAMARQTLTQYKRRINRSRKMQSMYNMDYSYSTENFQPLGLQLFRHYIKPLHSSLEFLINKDIEASPSHFSEPKPETGRELYSLDEGDINPFKWEVDVCSMVLGNFNYKKMSLVRDYNTLIEDPVENTLFNELFSDQPRRHEQQTSADIRPEDQYTILKADATQLKAIHYARQGKSYIIQGPPGTGKSQTITNLVADYIAQGKKVLFVCEKRAAIDVVYHRLRQHGLDELCCLIHDSQSDKKAFIMGLKETHEKFLLTPPDITTLEAERNVLVAKINTGLNVLRDFHNMMNRELEESKILVRQLIEILVRQHDQNLHFEGSADDLPGYGQWTKFGSAIRKLSSVTLEYSGQPYFSRHPARFIGERFFAGNRSAAQLAQDIRACITLALQAEEKLSEIQVPENFSEDIAGIRTFLEKTMTLTPFREKDMVDLLDPKSSLFKKLNEAVRTLKRIEKELQECAEKNIFWINKLSKADTENALAVLQRYEKSFFSFLNGRYRQTRKIVKQSYDFDKHMVKPPLSQVVENLRSEYQAEEKLRTEKTGFEELFDMGDLYELKDHLKTLQEQTDPAVLTYIKTQAGMGKSPNEIKQLNSLFEEFYFLLQDNTRFTEKDRLKGIAQKLEEVIPRISEIEVFSPLMQELRFANEGLKKLITTHDLDPGHVEWLLARSSLHTFYTRNRHLEKMEGASLQHHIESIRQLYDDFMEANAKCILARQQNAFRELIAVSEMSMAGKSEKEKEEKKQINEGRRILENEFGKTMRYKSIRELAAGESGKIIRELKPVWLMSPLSVSDTLPIHQDYFDVVIFDEASQITLEEGIPPLYRTRQVIIVGDEMQMPPSNFFSSSNHDPDDLYDNEEDSENIFISLEADSFLSQGARKFPSVMLGWHYRSKHESLIGFSNASFYNSQLLTVPDSYDQQRDLNNIVAEKNHRAADQIRYILDRPISYHYLEHGIYENRRNPAEALYIAELVRELLSKETGLSIGVVAFSMEQQAEIEEAVDQLAATDAVFAKRIEEEYRRVDDNQFNGIFFKNLENVQGDERDIIIMSTCYGYDAKGKMIMNFGPINRRGGEKRLNVIFSRAKKHMCVISSVRYTDIKNEYNEGAGYFRKYLQYAALASQGKMDQANLVLSAIKNKTAALQADAGIVVKQIAQALENEGYAVKTNIGQSYFKCHIGIKKNQEDLQYLAGVLVDDETHYANADIMEQYVFKPELMRATGWNITQVYSKDWLEDREKVMARLRQWLGNKL